MSKTKHKKPNKADESKKSKKYPNRNNFVQHTLYEVIRTPKDKLLTNELENMKINYQLLNKKVDVMENALGAIEDRDNNVYRTYFNTSPITDEERKAGFGGVNRYKDLEGYNNSDLVINTSKKIDRLMKEMAIQSESLNEIVKLGKQKEKLLAAIPAIQPVKNEDS